MDSIGKPVRTRTPSGSRDHLTSHLVFAAPDWSLEEAAVAMVRGGFRHLVVTEGGDIAGVLSVRDVVRCWTDDGAICDVPESAGIPSPRLDDPERHGLLLGLVAGGVGCRRGDPVASPSELLLADPPAERDAVGPDLAERLSVPFDL